MALFSSSSSPGSPRVRVMTLSTGGVVRKAYAQGESSGGEGVRGEGVRGEGVWGGRGRW